jgi:hypothetical protein
VRLLHRGISVVVVCLVFRLLAVAPLPSFAGLPPEPHAPQATTVTLKAAGPSVSGCGSVRVEIWVNGVTDLNAADVHVQFDPALLQVVDADVDAPGVQIEPIYTFMYPGFIIKRIACNAADPNNPDCPVGGIVWYAANQVNPAPPASGSGALVAFTLVGAAEGVSPLDISYQKLSDPRGRVILSTGVGGSIGVTAPTPVHTSIAAVNATTARLSWLASPGAAGYRLYRAAMPYFSPTEPPYRATSALAYNDVGALGGVGVEYYYVVKAVCSSGFTSASSNRTGAFDFALVGGS